MKKSEFHFANTFFENDFGDPILSINQLICAHPNYYQLQFLPSVYGTKEDHTILSFPYQDPTGKFVFIDDLKKIESPSLNFWGISNCINQFNHDSMTINNLCAIELVKILSSKLWSFSYTKKFLPQALILSSIQDFENFLEKNFFPCVIKNPNGFSSRGNILLQSLTAVTKNDYQNISLLLSKTKLIIEPWLKRMIDFSTQWLIGEKEIYCLGATELINSFRGSYLGNIFRPKDQYLLKAIPEIHHHYEVVRPILEEIQKLGFRGHLGIDAFFYENASKVHLQPIVEINPRKTMGYVAIKVAENNRFESPIFLRLNEGQKCKFPLLPLQLNVHNQLIRFKKNLEFQSDSGAIPHANYENPRWNTFKWNY